MYHYRPVLLVIFAVVGQIETFRQVVIYLNGSQLPLPAECILYHKVELGAIKGCLPDFLYGFEASGQIGLAAELEAVSKQFAAGDENLGASVQGSAKVEAMLGAEGKIGAYIDEHGITIGAEARAGAYVSAQANVTFEAHVFGLSTTVKLYAEVHAGFMAHGEAVVTIGFDGKVKFQVGAGVSIGIGASAGMEFEVDASELIKKLGLKDLDELLKWVEEFQKDPKAKIGEIIDEGVDRLIKTVIEPSLDNIPVVPGFISAGDIYRFIKGPGDGDDGGNLPDPDPVDPREPGPDDDVKNPQPPNAPGEPYQRNRTYETKYSK